MLVREDISTRIVGVDDDHSNRVLIRESFNRIKINLPTSFGYKIEVASFKVTTTRTSFIMWITRFRKQNVGIRTCKDRYYNFYCLGATNCDIYIIWR